MTRANLGAGPGACVLALVGSLAACGDAPPGEAGFAGRSVAPPGEPEIGVVRLRAHAEVPLRPFAFARLDSGLFVTPDPAEPLLWELRPAPDTTEPWPGPLLVPGGARILALAQGDSGVGALDQEGWLAAWDPRRRRVGGRFRLELPAPGYLVGLGGAGPSGWAVLRVEGDGSAAPGSRFDLVLATYSPLMPGGRERWRAPAGNAWAAAMDFPFLHAAAGTLYIARANPLRVVALTAAGGGRADSLVLRGAPRRQIPESLRTRMRRDIGRGPAGLRGSDVPELYPASYRLWRHGAGFLAAAGTGEESEALDWYCGDRFQRTLLAGPDYARVDVLPDAVVARRRLPGSFDAILEFYRLSQFPLACTEAP